MPRSIHSGSTTTPDRAAAKIRVLCVDDSDDITMTLGRCIDREPDMENAGSMQSADDLLMEVKRLRPDVVLLDMTMPGKEPLAAVRELMAASVPHGDMSSREDEGQRHEVVANRAVRVIVFSGHSDPVTVKSAADAGACGFLSKDAEITVILKAIREVSRGTVPFGVWP